MIRVVGKATEAIIFSENKLDTAVEQIQELVDQPFMEGTKVRIMPDYHAGKGCVIGTTIQLNGKVVPNLVGVDVGCGVLVTKVSGEMDFAYLDRFIRNAIPSGTELHRYTDEGRTYSKFDSASFLADGINNVKTNLSLGTLGGGNHFIEVAKNDKDEYYLLIHTGSRYLGAKVAKYHQDKAISNMRKMDTKAVIAQLKSEGLHSEIEATLKKMKEEMPDVPKDLAYLEGRDYYLYIQDMKRAQQYAVNNRADIAINIIRAMGWTVEEQFDSIHNYIDTGTHILRKGAVRALEGEKLVIPMNMRDGSLICVGKGNPDWNYSAPHGAGRLFSRTQAMKNLTMDDFQKSMEGIWTSSVNEETLDEAPMAYKPMEEIISQIHETVDILEIVKPVYNFKASDKWKK